MRTVRSQSIVALTVSLVLILGMRGPWLTSGDVHPAIWALFFVVLPVVALSLGVVALRSARAKRSSISQADTVLAWTAVLLPAGWLAVRVLFVFGEALSGS